MTTIVLVHGAWLTPLSWEHVADHLTGRGYDVRVPAWPGHDRPVEEVRADPSPLEGLGVRDLVDHVADVVGRLPEPPALVGHSFGGLIVQMLLDRGLGAAGVSLCPPAPRGVLRLPASTLRAVGPVLSRPAHRRRAVALTFPQFRYAFTTTWDETDARAAYDRYAVPETGRIFFEAGTANLVPRAATALRFGRDDRAPLLLAAAEHDRANPPSVVRATARRYRAATAHTDHHVFPGRSHLLLTGPGWREVAEHVDRWLGRVL